MTTPAVEQEVMEVRVSFMGELPALLGRRDLKVMLLPMFGGG